jgi:hypothetical protein
MSAILLLPLKIMDDLHKNIHRKDETPYGEIFISPLEKDKRQKEENDPRFKNTINQTFSILANYFQQLLGVIDSKADAYSSTPTLQKALEDLKAFRKLLTTLAGEDCSHNPIFNQQLSQLWHNLLDDCNSLPSKEGYSSLILSKLNFFICQIQNFPIGSEHTLGYYFSHDVGEQWIPFPCMKLLQELHEEFRASATHSTLHNWILLIDAILLT